MVRAELGGGSVDQVQERDGFGSRRLVLKRLETSGLRKQDFMHVLCQRKVAIYVSKTSNMYCIRERELK